MVAPGRLDLLWVTKPKVTVVQAAESITRKMTTMQGIVVEVVAPAGSCLRDTADQSKSSRHIPCAVHLESWQKLDCERHGGARGIAVGSSLTRRVTAVGSSLTGVLI